MSDEQTNTSQTTPEDSVSEVDKKPAEDAVVLEDVDIPNPHIATGPTPDEKIKELEAALAQEKDKTLRAMAELENYKRRKDQELESFKKYAAEKVVLAFLSVKDDFDRAFAHISSEHSKDKSLLEGLELVAKQLNSALEKCDVAEIKALNQAFDPHKHQAILHEDGTEIAPDMVVKVMQAGYTLKDRVIRPSMVVVSK